MKQVGLLFGFAAGTLFACGNAPSESSPADSGVDVQPEPTGTPIPAAMQRPGDPAKGYHVMVNAGYVSCGVPYSAYARVFGKATDAQKIPGREGHNADLPYNLTATIAKSGVEIVAPNCLSCHAGVLDGKLMVGLGNAQGDFTSDPTSTSEAVGFLLTDEAEKTEWRRWADRVKAIGPWSQTKVVGTNPADSFTAVLFAHRDRKTLAWSETPLLDLPPKIVLPTDVPPWWRMKKKTSMFYTAGGRGDHARIMMTASTLCTDSVEEAKTIDSWFPDVRAWIASLEPPKWTRAIDSTLTEKGRVVFETTCSRCHGTYGASGSYPNLLVAIEDVNTDSAVAIGGAQFGAQYVKWFNESFYGELATFDPQKGYVAPPLDGIWATAPFFHNASVPTLEGVIDSSKRPKFWTRVGYTGAAAEYDELAVGWKHTALPAGQSSEPDERKRTRIYDTTLTGHGNGGHTFGDALSDVQRTALLEYLKTL
jgi:mono/diheme cytochrome c family protein